MRNGKSDIIQREHLIKIWRKRFMQKTFIRYTFAIMTTAVFLIFIINCLLTMHNLNTQQYNTFCQVQTSDTYSGK